MIRRIGAAMGLAAVALGAFGAHGLEGRMTAQALGWWDTATFYLLTHAVLVTAIGLVASERALRRAAAVMAAGAAVFAATLYAMALGAPTVLGAVTPLGGLLMLAGWVGLLTARSRMS